MKHTLSWMDEKGKVKLDYRPVHAYTLTNDVAYIEPKAASTDSRDALARPAHPSLWRTRDCQAKPALMR